MSESNKDASGGVVTQKKTRVQTKKPKPYNVVLWNDDYTSMEFVVYILEQIFRHSPSKSTQIMLHIHNKGKGVAGTYTRDVAETRVAQVTKLAQQNGHPLKTTAEPA